MINYSYIDAFIPEGKDASHCSSCGICLQKCPSMKMDKEESKSEIMRLINGEEPERVQNECTFCFNCNNYCPNGLKPYFLIMERMTAGYRDGSKKLPRSFGTDDSFTRVLYDSAPDEDKAIVTRWAKAPSRAKDTLFIGCDGRTVPGSIEYSKTLSSLTKFGPRDACCGEIPFRFGDLEAFDAIVKRTYKYFQSLETERLVCYCGSCASTINNIWAKFYNFKLPFEVISLYEWLWEKYQSGEFHIQQQDPRKIAVSDSCYSSEMGEKFYTALRGLYEASGLSLVELENTRYDSLCCGLAVTLRAGGDNPSAIGAQSKKKADQVLAAEQKEVICNCPGCYTFLNQAVTPRGMKVRFALNEILWAFGDETRDIKRRTPSGELI